MALTAKNIEHRKVLGICLFFFAGFFVVTFSVSAESLEGYVFNELNRPVPGLTVSIVNAQAGRSAPSVTDSTGHYYFPNVPISGLYYLEVYWGRDLLYRTSIQIHGNFQNSPIVLR
jgi:hypothetical protein